MDSGDTDPRRNSYQKDGGESLDPPPLDLSGRSSVASSSSSHQEVRERRQSSKNSTTSLHRGGRRRSSRPQSLIMTIRQAFAFNIDDYEPTDIHDQDVIETFSDEDDNNNNDNDIANNPNQPSGDPCRCRNLVLFGLILAVLIAAPIMSTYRHGSGQQQQQGGEMHKNNNSPPTDLEDVLGTCRDPIMNLKTFSTIDGIKSGAVAADHPLCSQMGTSVMRDLGGNAVDAAVTVALCLGVANPASSGIGGGGFILVHADPNNINDNDPNMPSFHDARSATGAANADSDSGKVTEVVDCREVAPSAAYTNMFLDNPDELASTYGGLAAGVPAELRGLELAHARHGKLSWAQVVQPALKLARDGAPVNGNLAHEIRLMAGAYDGNDPGYGLRKLLTHNDDWSNPLQEGDLLKNEKLADTLEAVMTGGSNALYKGERAAGLARDIQNAGGVMTREDIEAYIPTLRSPVVAHDIQGFSIAGVPPPSSGGAAIVGIARFLAGYETPLASFAKTLSIHRFVEACRHAFAIRMSLSDPAYNPTVVQDAVRALVEGNYMEELRKATMDNTTLPLSHYGGSAWAQLNDTDGDADAADAKEGDRRHLRRRRLWREFGYLEDHGTSHFSIVDLHGNAVAMTTSVNMYFGSGIVSESTGIVVNNQMDDFATPGRPNGFGLAPSEANYIEGGKKPLSSMSPTMIFRRSNKRPEGSFGELLLVVGASGGPKIITAVVQIFLNHIILGMPLFEATIHPRVHDQLIYHGSAVTTVEKSKLETGEPIIIENRTVAALRARHHDILDIDYMGTVQCVSVDLETDTLSASCDVRKGGSPDGY